MIIHLEQFLCNILPHTVNMSFVSSQNNGFNLLWKAFSTNVKARR